METHRHGRGVEPENCQICIGQAAAESANAKSVRQQGDASGRARLFGYEIGNELVDGEELSLLLERRYGDSSVGGRRFNVVSRRVNETALALEQSELERQNREGRTISDVRKDVWKHTWLVCVPEDSDGGPLKIGSYVLEPSGDEAEDVELTKMIRAKPV